MKKIKQFIHRVKTITQYAVRYTLLSLAVVILVYATIMAFNANQEPMEYEKPTPTVEPIIEAPKENDVEQAEKMLAEATQKLNAEEEKLLAEIEEIETNAATQVAEREAKIAEINAIRSSF